MFHLQPGTGLGFSGSRELALGLGGLGVVIDVPPEFLPGGTSKKRHGPSARQIQQQQQIEEENAVMLSVVKAFLKVVD